MEESSTLALLKAALRDPVRKKRFVDSQRERWGWTGSYKQALARIDQWLDEDDPHRFPAESLEDVVRVIGDAHFLDPVLAVEAKVMRERRRSHETRVPPREARSLRVG